MFKPKSNHFLLGWEYDKAYRFAQKHKFWSDLNPKEANKCFNRLKMLKYENEAIQAMPQILKLSEIMLRNRHSILQEVGVPNISISIILKYLNICHKQINVLKAHQLLPEDTDVIKNIFHSFQLEPSLPLRENQLLEEVRCEVLSEYLQKVLRFSDSDIKRFWNSYSRAKHKSATSILEVVHLLKTELNFDDEIIQKNPFVIYADPLDIKSFLTNFEQYPDLNIREMLQRRPKLICSNPDNIKETLSVIKLFNIPSKSLAITPEVLTLSPKTVHERLTNIKTIKDFEGLIDNPRILKLVYYQMKAKARLQYLHQLKFKNASLNILSSGSEVFERYTREGADKTKGCDTTAFLVKHLDHTEDEIREYFGRHCNWICIPLTTVKDNFDMLKNEKFSSGSIFNNIHLLLYPPERVAAALKRMRSEVVNERCTQTQLLALVLYHIESEYHFTGDGVWTEPVDSTSVRSIDPHDTPALPPVSVVAGFGGRRAKKEVQP